MHGDSGGEATFLFFEGLCRLYCDNPFLTLPVISSGPLLSALTDKETGDTPQQSWRPSLPMIVSPSQEAMEEFTDEDAKYFGMIRRT